MDVICEECHVKMELIKGGILDNELDFSSSDLSKTSVATPITIGTSTEIPYTEPPYDEERYVERKPIRIGECKCSICGKRKTSVLR